MRAATQTRQNRLPAILGAGLVLFSVPLLVAVAHTQDPVVALIIGGGGVIGLLLTLCFFLKPARALLVFYGLRGALEYVMSWTAPVPGTGISFALGGPLQGLLLLLGGLKLLFSERSISKVPGFATGLIFLALTAVSIWPSPDHLAAFKEWSRIASLFVIYLVLATTCVERDWSAFKWALLGSLLIPLPVGFYQALTGTGLTREAAFNRIYATLLIPNVYAAFLILPLLFCLVFALEGRRQVGERTFLAVVGLLCLLSLFLTYSRASWAAALAGVLFIGAWRHRKLLFLVPAALVLGGTYVSLQALRLGEFSSGQITFSGRIGLWGQLLSLAWTHPLVGWGLTSIYDVERTHIGYGTGGQSDYVRLLIECGLPGLLAYVVFAAATLRGQLVRLKAARQTAAESYCLAVTASLIAFMTVGLAETNALLQWYAWIPAGVVVGATWPASPEEAR